MAENHAHRHAMALGNFRMYNSRLAVSPDDANVVLLGTDSNGLRRSTDGGATWTQASGIPNGVHVSDCGNSDEVAGITGIAFDKASNGQVVYAAASGKGVYRSTDGGASWSAIGGTQGVVSDGTVAGGTYYATVGCGGGGGVWIYRNNKWSQGTPNNGGTWGSITVDPTNANRVYAMNISQGGQLYRSLDGGVNWTQLGRSRAATGDVGWLAWLGDQWLSIGRVMFDPTNPSRIWLSEGVGVWYADVSDTATSVVWNAQSRGIEELVSVDIVMPPGGKPVTAVWDQGLFYHANFDTYPSQRADSKRFRGSWNLDFSEGTPSFLVATSGDNRCYGYWPGNYCDADGQGFAPGYSTDGGQSWTRFASVGDTSNSYAADSLSYGAIVVNAGDTNNIVLLPSADRPLRYTRDRGQSWQVASGLPSGGHAVFYLNRRMLAADRVTAGTFYLVVDDGTYRSADGGANWTKLNSGPDGDKHWNAKLKAVFGQAGHLFYTTGGLDGVDTPFYRSTNGGASWATVANVTRVNDFAYGKAAPGSNYPTIFIAGKVNNDYGLWRSTDAGASWTKLATHPLGYIDEVTTLAADRDVYGRVYIGFSGSGFAYGDMRGSTPAPTSAPTTVPTAVPGNGGNLLSNGSFDNGCASWMGCTATTTNGAYNTNAAKVGGNGAAWLGQQVPAQAGVAYTFSTQLKTSCAASQEFGGFGYAFLDSAGNSLASAYPSLGASASWTQKTFTATAPANTAALQVNYWGGNTSCSLYVDDVSVRAK